MLSLNARLLVAASIVLAAFLSLTGLALDRAFRQSALASTQERLHGQVLLLLGAAEILDNELRIPDDLPEARFSSPASGLFAEVVTGSGETVWRSRSSLAVAIDYPESSFDGQSRFELIETSSHGPVFSVGFGVTWELDDAEERRFEFRVAESTRVFDEQVARFRGSLWFWLSAAAAVLLLIQAFILRWGLSPLRQVANEVREVEAGVREQLADNYPRELKRLTNNLNELVRHGRARLTRYRNALDDLAHGLKTPLAVLTSLAESQISDTVLRDAVNTEIERMHRTVNYQLQRASASGKLPLSTPVDARSVARRLAESLTKVYAQKQLAFSIEVEGGVFRGDEGDLTEILGNLMDNASKWARSTVTVRFFAGHQVGEANAELVIEVEDDGPGFADSECSEALERGVRSKSDKAGQGIGLAIVREIVEELYGGRVEIGRCDGNGARVRLLI